MRACVTLAVLFVASGVGAADKPVPLVPIDTKAKSIAVAVPERGDMLKPTEIKSADELAKSPLFAKADAEKVKKEVNFEKEKLVVFAWSGSGQDRVAGTLVTADKKATATFVFTPGATLDLRSHAKLFVLPKDATVKAERNPRAK